MKVLVEGLFLSLVNAGPSILILSIFAGAFANMGVRNFINYFFLYTTKV